MKDAIWNIRRNKGLEENERTVGGGGGGLCRRPE